MSVKQQRAVKSAEGGIRRWVWLGIAVGLAWPGPSAAAAFCEFQVEREGDVRSAVADAAVYPFGLMSEMPALTVFDEAGAAVPRQVLWQASQDPWRIRFDASAGSRWRIRFDDAAATRTGMPWTARAGVILETRELPEGAVETLADFERLWSGNSRVLGRSEVGRIFHGFHPHGPDRPLLARYVGWLQIPAAGSFRFATLTDDASFLLINDRPVVSWGGWHSLQGGERGERNGAVDLPAGPCKITLLNAQKDAEFLSGAYWRPPGAAHAAVIPASAFLPVAATRIQAVTASQADAGEAAFGWEMDEHFLAGEQLWVKVRLRILAPGAGVAYAWRMDDGAEGQGAELDHLFFTAGSREVAVQATREGRVVGRLTQRIRVHAKGQQQEFGSGSFARLQADLLRRDYAALPLPDLCNAILLADTVHEAPLLTAFGEAALQRLREFSSEQLLPIQRLGFHFQSPPLRRYDDVARLWRALIARTGAPGTLVATTQLHLAGMLIHSGGGLGEALALLQDCNLDLLDGGARRLHLIFRGDAAAAAGDVEQSLRLYREAGGTVAADDTAFEVRRVARLERARAYLKMKDYDAAEATLRELEWERPVTRLGLETGLLLIDVFRMRGEMEIALALCRRLRAVAPAGPRQADLLQKTVVICEALGLNDEANAARVRLDAEFPYSEASAILREQQQQRAGSPSQERQ